MELTARAEPSGERRDERARAERERSPARAPRPSASRRAPREAAGVCAEAAGGAGSKTKRKIRSKK